MTTDNITIPSDLVEVLSPKHYKMLHIESAISDDVIRERGYRTIYNAHDLADYNIPAAQRRAPSLLLPLHTTEGQIGFYVLRPDDPRVFEDKEGNRKIIKYETPKNELIRLDCPPRCREQLGDPSVPLWITEGQKKADALASAGQYAIALLGVWNYVTKRIDRKGRVRFDVDWECVEVKGRVVYIVFDSDVMTKPEVRQALDRLTEKLQRKGAQVSPITLLPMAGKEKMGVDDYLAAGHTIQEIEALKDSIPVQARAPADQFTLLDEPPPIISRPLSLLNGQAYAAAWLYGERKSNTITVRGETKLLSSPVITRARHLFIVRSDGAIFGDDNLQARDVLPLSQLGIDVHLPEVPSQSGKLWSMSGVKKYRAGERPDPVDVFNRVRDNVDRFIDFDRSLADQKTMSDLIACYILSTWMIESASVAGFLWLNGEKGCGKSQLLFVIAEMSHIGQAITTSSSPASVRDLCDYGATLGLDDAEDLSDPTKTDPQIRALLLAGNRRGVTVTLKEQGANGQWVTRNVNAFCPKVFSAINKPDDVLSSRCVIIPLVRTPDRKRGNADPLDHKQWAHDHRELIDDLWALALSQLSTLAQYDLIIAERSRLIGRDLQPFRGLLAVAKWLDDRGVVGLWERIESLASTIYQVERETLEVADETRVIVMTLISFAQAEPEAHELKIATANIVERMKKIIEDEEIDINTERLNSKSIGRRLSKMRLTKSPDKTNRGWIVKRNVLKRIAASYKLELEKRDSDTSDPSRVNALNASNASNASQVEALEALKAFEALSETGKVCPNCKNSSWWTRADGETVCNVCHPNPAIANDLPLSKTRPSVS
jgi:hypothetical protein